MPKFTKWDWVGLISAFFSFAGFIGGTLSSVNTRDDLDSRVDIILDERGYEPKSKHKGEEE